jgi:Polyketide cyclase / dehydrase and lipid transport
VVTLTRCCETIAAPAPTVWAAIERVESHVQWMADAVRIDPVGPARQGVGAEYVCETRVGPFRTRDRLMVTDWAPGERMTVAHVGAVRGEGRFALRAVGDRTEFCWEEALWFPWWMGGPVGERLARPVLRRVWRGNLRRLRAQIEAR